MNKNLYLELNDRSKQICALMKASSQTKNITTERGYKSKYDIFSTSIFCAQS